MTKAKAIEKLRACKWSPRADVERNIDIYLMRIDGFTFVEISEEYNLSLTGIRAIYLNCRKKLGFNKGWRND